jgi:4-amino-4-deoxy-L-arabinose transferase-like glycosyltransferase
LNSFQPKQPLSGTDPEARVPPRLSPEILAALIVTAVTAIHILYSGLVPLSAQEAYYWQYARHLDLSYYDHPPLAAWTIWAAMSLFGDSERAIRAAAVFHSLVFALFFFLTGRRLFGSRTAFLALATALATPLFTAAQTIITPDGPLLSGWAAAMYFTVRALQSGRGAWLAASGVAVGWAALGKYTGWLLAPLILVALLFDARGRRILLTPWPYLGLGIAAAIFSPVLVWNSRHGWISFAFQFGLRSAKLGAPHARLIGSFVGLQTLTVTPILCVLLWTAAVVAARRFRDPPMRLCALFSLPALLLFLAVSPFTWVKGNWTAPAYPAALLAAAALYLERRNALRRLAAAAVGLALLATIYVHAAPLTNLLPFPPSQDPSAGWRELAARVAAEQAKIEGPSFVIGCYYKTASELAYYLPGRPETYSTNALDDEGLQYDFWLDKRVLQGRQAIVVLDQRDWKWCLKRGEICSPLEPLEPLTVRRPLHPIWNRFRMRDEVTTFQLWRCGYPRSP